MDYRGKDNVFDYSVLRTRSGALFADTVKRTSVRPTLRKLGTRKLIADVLPYLRCASVANGETDSVTELLGRRGGMYAGIGGRCSSVPSRGASSTPAPNETN